MHRLLLLLLVVFIVLGFVARLRKHWLRSNEAQKRIDWTKVNRDQDDDDDWGDPPKE